MIHTHKCCRCPHTWECDLRKKKTGEPFPIAKCPVTTAAQVNGDGPHCSLCLHLDMAGRYAEARGLKLQFTLTPKVNQALSLLKIPQ